MAMRRPAEVFPPGDFLREELEERGWTQADLADIVGRPIGTVNEIIKGKRKITPETAEGLSSAFGTSAEFWLNLESAYQLSKLKGDNRDEIAHRAKLYAKAPIKDMVRRGWIEPSDNVVVLESRLLRFLEIDSLDDDLDVLRHAARKGTSYGASLTPAQHVWLVRARQLSRSVQASPYQEANLAEAVRCLKALRRSPQELRDVPRILSEAGIKFVIVQPLPGNRIDGACFWADESPVIAMSLRYDRIDNFWFVLMHELGHLERGIETLDTDLDATKSDAEKPATEREADTFAMEQLVPQQEMERFIAGARSHYSDRDISAFAEAIGVHPGIVVGQLHHRKELSFSSYRTTLEPVREVVTAAAVTDGWGTVLPVKSS
ncbi:MAG: HigA family addiction module antitoxin [Thermomicrobiales bacterium]